MIGAECRDSHVLGLQDCMELIENYEDGIVAITSTKGVGRAGIVAALFIMKHFALRSPLPLSLSHRN